MLRPGQTRSPYVGPAATSILGDHKVLVDGSDTTAGYLSSKLDDGTGISFTILNPGANEVIQINNTGILAVANVGAGTGLVWRDTVAGTANIKSIIGGTGITVTNNADDITITNSSTEDHKLSISAADTTPNYGENKILAGTGITVTKENAGGNEDLKIANSGILSLSSVGAGTGIIFKGTIAGVASIKTLVQGTGITITNNTDDITIAASSTDDHKVMVSATDTTPDYLLNKINSGTGINAIQANPAGNEQVLVRTAGRGFVDTFQKLNPFWENTDVLTSSDWSVSVGNYLLGGAENNTYDSFRLGIQGDFDYAMKFALQSAAQCGMQFTGNSITVQYLRETTPSNRLRVIVTGNADVTLAFASTTFWLRVQRFGDLLQFFYRVNDTDSWILLTSTTKVMLDMVIAYLRSANTARINPVYLFDNEMPQRIASDAPKVVALTDAAPIVVDARRGNVFTFTMTASRQLQNPTNPLPGQKIIFRIKQGGAGSFLLTYDTKYRFSTSLPSPVLSTAVGSTDYLGFIYNLSDDKWDFIAFVQGFT